MKGTLFQKRHRFGHPPARTRASPKGTGDQWETSAGGHKLAERPKPCSSSGMAWWRSPLWRYRLPSRKCAKNSYEGDRTPRRSVSLLPRGRSPRRTRRLPPDIGPRPHGRTTEGRAPLTEALRSRSPSRDTTVLPYDLHRQTVFAQVVVCLAEEVVRLHFDGEIPEGPRHGKGTLAELDASVTVTHRCETVAHIAGSARQPPC